MSHNNGSIEEELLTIDENLLIDPKLLFIGSKIGEGAHGRVYEGRSVSALLGMGEECWAMMRNELIKELGKWSQDYIKIFGGTKRYEQLRLSLHVDGLSKVCVLCFLFT